MLAYITYRLPQSISVIYCHDILPHVNNNKYIIRVGNILESVNIAQYFAFIECESLFHYCILNNKKLIREGFKGLSNASFLKVFINLDYTQFDTSSIVNIIYNERRFHTMLIPLVKKLKHAVNGYTHLSKDIMFSRHNALFDLINLPEEIDYILSIASPGYLQDLCDQFIETCGVFGSKAVNMNKSTLRTILDNVSRKNCEKDAYRILYAIAHDKTYSDVVLTTNAAVIFVQKLYNKSYTGYHPLQYKDVELLEPLLTTEESKLILIDILKDAKENVFGNGPNTHEVIMRATIKHSKVYNTYRDDCSYCRSIVSI